MNTSKSMTTPVFDGWYFDSCNQYSIGNNEGAYYQKDGDRMYCVATGVDNSGRWARVMFASDFAPVDYAVFLGDKAIAEAIDRAEYLELEG